MVFIPPKPDPEARSWGYEKLPTHIAIIMDGNGRWAKNRARARVQGHWEGARRVDEITTECAKLGVSYLTVYAFSTENWNRPKKEVDTLFRILVHYLRSMEKKLIKNRIRLISQGTIEQLPESARIELARVEESTSQYEPRMYLNLSLSYGARQEILDATKRIIKDKLSSESVSEETLQKYLYQPNLPDPDLLIRTGGESRISNFLLWQLAYTELYFTKTLWPDFKDVALHEAIDSFSKRERRYGLTSEQVQVHPTP